MGAITGNAIAIFKNLDSTNYVEVGIQSGGTFYATIRIKPADITPMFRFTSAAPYYRANTAACNVEYALWEE